MHRHMHQLFWIIGLDVLSESIWTILRFCVFLCLIHRPPLSSRPALPSWWRSWCPRSRPTSGVSNPTTTKEQVGEITANKIFIHLILLYFFLCFFYAMNCFLRTIFHKGAIGLYRIKQVKRLVHNEKYSEIHNIYIHIFITWHSYIFFKIHFNQKIIKWISAREQ